MEIQIKAYAYTIDIITEIRYFCKCNNAVFGKFRIIFTCAISKTDCSLHHNFHALFKISGNGKFVRTATLASLVKGEVLSPERIRATTGGIAAPLSPRPAPTLPKTHYPLLCTITLAFRRASVCVCLYGFASALSHLAFRRVRVCVNLFGFTF